MTYNILFTNRNAEAITQNILRYQPDLVALQEVLPSFFPEQQQARTVLDALRTADTAIFACDCNVRDPSSIFRFVSAEMRSASRELGWAVNAALPPGTQLDTDLQHLDYIFYRGVLRLNLAYSISDSGGSDHLPLVAEFGFR